MTAITPVVRVLVQNDSGMTIPPRSIVVVTSVETSPTGPGQESRDIHHVTQYGCGQKGNVLVTGPSPIMIGSKGSAFFDQFLYVSIDQTVATPTPGEQWGPSDNSWVITRGGVGFFAQGYSVTGNSVRMSMFLRTFVRAPSSTCSSSSSSSWSSSSSLSSGISGSSSSSAACGCVTVVTGVSCTNGNLIVQYGQARGCC